MSTPPIENPEQRGPQSAWMALLFLFLAVYLGSQFSPALLDDADATHAEAAREMAASNDFVALRLKGLGYWEKPPLPYWVSAVSMKIFGVNEAAARLPLTLGVLLSMLLAMAWSKRAFGARAGTHAGLFVLTSTGFYLITRIFIPEVLVGLLTAATLYFWLTALEDGDAWRWYAGYAALALSVLTKGLIGPVFAGGSAFLYLLVTGEWRRWRKFRLLTGFLLFFAIAAPWHILAGLRNTGGVQGRGFFWFYFVNEHYLRFLGRRFPRDYNKMPAAAYWLAHLVWLFPWSLYLPLTLRHLSFGQRTRTFAEKTQLICWIYAGLVLIFFAISTNQEYYTFPAYLPLIILLSAGLAQQEQSENGKFGWLASAQWAYALLGLSIAAALFSGLWASRGMAFVPDIGTVLAKRGVGDYTLSMSHFFDLTNESFAALRLPAALAAIAMFVGPILALWFRVRRRHYAATWTVGITTAVFLIAAHIALVRFEPYLSSKSMAQKLQRQLKADDRVMIYGDQSYGSSMLFYLRQPIYLVNGNTTSMYFGSTFPDAPKVFLDDQDLRDMWHGANTVYLFVPGSKLNHAEELLGPRARVFDHSGENTIFTNR